MALTFVSATVMAKDGRESELKAALAGIVDAVRAEEGCIRYDLHESDYGNAFFFYEIWESDAHLAAHAKAPHMEAMKAATEDLVAGPATVNVWRGVDVAS